MKNLSKNAILFLTSFSMVLCIFEVIQMNLLIWMSQKIVPISYIAIAILTGAIVTLFHHQRSWRRLSVLFFHLTGLVITAVWIISNHFGLEVSFFSYKWLTDFFYQGRPFFDYFISFTLMVLVSAAWVSGIKFVTKPLSLKTISHRFDQGITVFGILFLFKLLTVIKNTTLPGTPSSIWLLVLFLGLGLFSLTIVRVNHSESTREFHLIKSIGFLSCFSLVIFLISAGLFTHFLSEMQNAANKGSMLISMIEEPMKDFIRSITYTPVKLNTVGPAAESSAQSGVVTFAKFGFLPDILAGFLFLFGATLLSILFYRFFIWFWGRTSAKPMKKSPGIWMQIMLLAFIIKDNIQYLISLIFLKYRNSQVAQRYFRQLVFWGRLSGVEINHWETPIEYGQRLAKRHLQFQQEIMLIIYIHDEAIYGLSAPNSAQVTDLNTAIRKIRKMIFRPG